MLNGNTAPTPLNVVGTIILDPSTAHGRFSYERVLKLLEERLPRLPPMRRRLVEVPFGLGHGVWIEDPKFALERHVRRVVARPPGTEPAPGAVEMPGSRPSPTASGPGSATWSSWP